MHLNPLTNSFVGIQQRLELVPQDLTVAANEDRLTRSNELRVHKRESGRCFWQAFAIQLTFTRVLGCR